MPIALPVQFLERDRASQPDTNAEVATESLPSSGVEPVANKRDEIPDSSPGSERILLVEDDESVRELASEILKMNGYEVIEAGNGVEALDVLKSLDDPVDLMEHRQMFERDRLVAEDPTHAERFQWWRRVGRERANRGGSRVRAQMVCRDRFTSQS